MFCRKCGTEISPDCAFCPRCGEKTVMVDESSKRGPASQRNEYEKAETIVTPVVNNEPAEQTHTEPPQTQQAYTQPPQAQPVYTQPSQAQPAYTEPHQGQPAYTQPPQTQPAHTQPVQAQPAYTEPPQGQPAYTQPPQTQPAYTQPPQTQPAYTQPTQGQPAYTQAAPKKTNNTKLFLGILGAAFALCIILAVVITVNAVIHSSFTSSQETTTTQETNTLGNTPSNILCDGIAAKQGNTIYYMQVDQFSSDDILMSMNLDGKTTQELYSFEGDISSINVIGNQVFFIGDVYDEDYNITESGIYVYDLTYEKTTNLFNYDDSTLYYLYVTSDQMYFLKSNEEDCDKIISSNLDGSNEQSVLEKEDYVNCFTILDSSFYYIYQDAVNRCDLDGQNNASLYTFDTLGPFCMEKDKLYISDNGTVNNTVISSMDLNGENETALATFDTNEIILYLNAVDDMIYYAVNTENEKGNVTGCTICAMNNDGTDKQTIVTTDDGIYGLAIFDHWLFYYNNNDYETVIVDLNDM